MKIQDENNSAFYPNPVVLVSAKHNSQESIITLAWAGTVCSDPPMVSISVRESRFSYQIINNSREFVINFPTIEMLDQVNLCGTKSGREIDKWEKCNFMRAKSKVVQTPSIAECPVNMECQVEQVIKLGSHDLFLAKVVALSIDDDWKNNKYPEMLTFTRGKYGRVKVL
ncbi:MAG: flavin reductase family protein [Promethearchaeota archaeon]